MSPRVKSVLMGVGTVVVLAAVILGISALGSTRKKTVPATIQLSPAQESLQAYQQGMVALSSEETSTAIVLLKRAASLNPTDTRAKTALDGIAKAARPSGESGEATPKPAPAPGVWMQELAMGQLLPKSFTDFALSSVDVQGADAAVSASPTKRGSTVTSIVWSVHDRKTAVGAEAFVTKVTKSLYGENAAKVTVSGAPGYFGTDGKRFATVTFIRGRYVFETVLTASIPPADIRTQAEKAAAAFAASP